MSEGEPVETRSVVIDIRHQFGIAYGRRVTVRVGAEAEDAAALAVRDYGPSATVERLDQC